MSLDQKRDDFRVTFPPTMTPKLVMEGKRYIVSDLSSTGIRVKIKPNEKYYEETYIYGEIQFSDRSFVNIEGTITRIESIKKYFVITFAENFGVPHKKMMELHRKVIQRRKNLSA